MIWIGIDNGVSGGLVALSESSAVLSSLPMPVQKARKGNDVDINIVDLWISALIKEQGGPATIIIEEPGGSKSAKAATSMAGSFHGLRCLCMLRAYRWHRITPQLWQKEMLPGCKAGDTKPRALEAVRRLWPDQSFLASDRCKVPHEGLVDAALIAEYARQKGL